ncbi:MAG: twin-arginine translocase subunit TatC [bacterium]|nr:twin-arginine translocase subunit TatC [bacterium]
MALDQIEESTLGGKEMGFFDHIDELRKHIIRAAVAILVCAVVIFFNKSLLFDTILFGPMHIDFWTYKQMCDFSYWLTGTDVYCVKEMGFVLSNIDITGQFTQHLFISFVGGFVVAFPFVLWQVWAFIRPALSSKEINYAKGFVFFSSALFFMGILFGYFLLAPLSINFLGSYKVSEIVSNEINLESYISFLATLTFACGLIFEMPMLVYFLAKIGILTSALMGKYRRYALVVILILSGILTPSPDMASQVMMALPLYGLFEISILVAKRVEKNKLK